MTASDGWHLAQVNIATQRFPLESREMAGFVTALEPINALADTSPGFVWRLQTEDGDATALRVFEDDRILINMSVWESLEALRAYVYESRHLEFMRRRREWFDRMPAAYLALWWLPPERSQPSRMPRPGSTCLANTAPARRHSRSVRPSRLVS